MQLFGVTELGSPPLTRGKAIDNYNREETHGITPAYAGKRAMYEYSPWIFEDHPRLRGEKNASACRKKTVQGSPPLTRGKVGKWTLDTYGLGITPAYAGKSW